MKSIPRLLAVVGFALVTGCGQPNAADSSLVVRLHFAGTNQVLADPEAQKLREIAALPQTTALLEQTLTRLLRSPAIFAGEAAKPEVLDRAAGLIRPLARDVLSEESFLEVRGEAGAQLDWVLAVALKPERFAQWTTNLSQLSALWQVGTAQPAALEGWTGSEVRRSSGGGSVRWAHNGGWVLLGSGPGPDPRSGFRRLAQQTKAAGRPVPALATSWMECEGDLARLAPPMGLKREFPWPRVQGTLARRDNQLRTTLRILWPEDITGPLENWQVPTNFISEPLIGFAVARGVGPLLSRSELLQRLKLQPAPNQFTLWAQSAAPVQSFWAMPTPNAASRVEPIAEGLRSLLGSDFEKRGLAQISYNPTNHLLIWKGLPVMSPHLRLARDLDTDFLVGGLFLAMQSTNALPAALLNQFLGRTNLLYYDWEVTAPRLSQWRLTAQLLAMIGNQAQLSPASAALPWLLHVEPLLAGNTASEIVRVSPREWQLTRKSDLGFTAFELVLLARWIESVDFPRASLTLPAPPRPSPPAAPAQRTSSNPPASSPPRR